MLHKGDLVVLFLIVAATVFLLLRSLRHLHSRKLGGGKPPSGPVPKLLAEHGYIVTSGEQRLPIQIEVDEETYDSRLYIDYIARRQDEVYLVAVSRPRKPLKFSGAAIRERFLAYYLAYRPAGILYVDRDNNSVRRIIFLMDEVSLTHPRRKALFTHLLTLGLGFIIALFLR